MLWVATVLAPLAGTDAVDVVFAFHGFLGAVHQLVHGRPDADRFHVRGFIEQGGTTTTPVDMTVLNEISRFHLVMDALNNSATQPPGAAELYAWCIDRLAEHRAYVLQHVEDLPGIRDWRVGTSPAAAVEGS